MAEVGRPSDFTQELADLICEELANGSSMRTVCKMDDMPSMSTVFKWLRDYKEFSEQYARAKQEAADAMAEEILDIADDAPSKVTGMDRSDAARVQAQRIRIDTRKWIMSKMKPKKYGDKLDLTSDGKKLEQPPLVVSQIKARNEDTQSSQA
jgi:hypothetical protein